LTSKGLSKKLSSDMIRTSSVRFFVVSLVLAAAVPSVVAQGRFALQLQAGGAFPEENKHRGGVETGFGVLLPVSGRTCLSLELMRWSVRSLGSLGKLYAGTVEISPVAASIRFELLRNQFFFPYVFGGAAVVFTRFRIRDSLSAPELRIEQKIENGLAPYIGLGARLTFSPALSFTGEAAYLPRTAAARTISRDASRSVSTEDITANLRTVFLKFGFQWSI
jgi:hypothetical protein